MFTAIIWLAFVALYLRNKPLTDEELKQRHLGMSATKIGCALAICVLLTIHVNG